MEQRKDKGGNSIYLIMEIDDIVAWMRKEKCIGEGFMLADDERNALEIVKGMVSEKYRLISQFASRTP